MFSCAKLIIQMKLLIFLILGIFITPVVNAQEIPIFSRTITVQTDLEEPVVNQVILCHQQPKRAGLVEEDEIIYHEITTNEFGEASLELNNIEDFVFMCSTKELTTDDYCWYFPNSTTSFEIYKEESKNTPLYLIGLRSSQTCDKEFTKEEIDDGIYSQLPQGTPEAYKNSNAYPTQQVNQQEIQLENQTIEEISLWQWIISKIKAIFQL